MISPAQAGVMSKIQQYEEKFKELQYRFMRQETIEIDIRLLRCLKKIENIEIVLNQIQSDSKCALAPSHTLSSSHCSYNPDPPRLALC